MYLGSLPGLFAEQARVNIRQHALESGRIFVNARLAKYRSVAQVRPARNQLRLLTQLTTVSHHHATA